MAANTGINLISPENLRANPENPRLIFHTDELRLLQDSIKNQGILVPLTVYRERPGFVILDGERRWRCALKLGLDKVPAIVQPKPDPLQNLMMMFAIHNQRRDWDPLPTAYKLAELEERITGVWERRPTEVELAELASIKRGEVRRLKALLALPESYRVELMAELKKPRAEQALTVDHVLEATRGASALAKRGVITDTESEEELRRAVVDKFKSRVATSTVEPRLLARIARAVERDEVSRKVARREVKKIVRDPRYTVQQAFHNSVEAVDFSHGTEQQSDRLISRLQEHGAEEFEPTESLRQSLTELARSIRAFLRD
jgi:ParB family transcriptional regulator, chromosome partitioning protein